MILNNNKQSIIAAELPVGQTIDLYLFSLVNISLLLNILVLIIIGLVV